jgi:predicted transposase YbfD/YdcC
MNYSTIPFEIELPQQEVVFDLTEFHQLMSTLVDQRGRQGRLYLLPVLLSIAVLAKLAGQNQIRHLADWAKLRVEELCLLFDLERKQMPHHTTWSRVLAKAVDPQLLTQTVAHYLNQATQQGPGQIPARGSLQLAIDGKALRGTIPLGKTHGIHLVAAYLPQSGVVLAQIAVEAKGNEIVVAPKLLAQIDLRGMVVTGDAMFCQRKLSTQIVGAGGDYCWTVKGNQKGVLEDIELLFEEPEVAPGCSAVPTDFEVYEEWNKGHGRIEHRVITVSSMLKDYTPWPHLEQVFKLESWRTDSLNRTSYEVRYGLTSLPRKIARPKCLLHLTRGHWGIEDGSHHRRDVTFGEDGSQLRRGRSAEVNAVLNNTAIGLLLSQGVSNVAEARREFEYHFHKKLFALA